MVVVLKVGGGGQEEKGCKKGYQEKESIGSDVKGDTKRSVAG